MLTSLLLVPGLALPQDLANEGRAWAASLLTPGGSLSFGLMFEARGQNHWAAFLVNAEERIEIPEVSFTDGELLLEMPHYDSRLRARLDHGRLVGTWEKRRGTDALAQVDFEATRGGPDCLGPGGAEEFTGRWRVRFETDEQDAVAVFQGKLDRIEGTFLTATGDYRYLDGMGQAGSMTLSCFDGAHAFLFKAELQPDGTLAGDFWSGNWHHEKWTAIRDEHAELADPFAQTSWNGRTRLADLAFPDLDGTKRSLGDFAGRATLLVVLGSWCPNCNDEAKLLKELDAKYRARGLAILGLAFELTGEFARDAEQVRIFARRHELAIPYFLCGTADKAEATRALGLVDRVRAFPTTIFVGADGLPKAIHSGFAGPATGAEHAKLRREFEARIEALLALPSAPR